MSNVIGFDTETSRFGMGNLAPKLVCITGATGDWPKGIDTTIYTRGDGVEKLEQAVERMLDMPQQKAAQNAKYDLGVICANFPNLIPKVWEALAAGKIHCLIIREKLLILSTTGSLEYVELPDGSNIQLQYNFAFFVKKYLDIDISGNKNSPDAWRTNYDVLSDIPVEEWPKEAIDYALDDARYTVPIYDMQEERRQEIIRERGFDPFETQNFRVACDFALWMMTCRGVRVDTARKAEITAMLERELHPEKHMLLVETGILRPAKPPRPHARNAKNKDGTVKMTKGEPESIDTKKLKGFAETLQSQFPEDVTLRRTPPSTRFPEGSISIDDEWLEEHAHLSPVLEEYHHRQKLQKLVTTELPRMMVRDAEGNPVADAELVHPNFNCMVSTGRTSAYADKLYPSFNIQNVDPRARVCFIPRDGFLLFSVDYSTLELCTWAQKCKSLFGFSVMADILNAGIDPHAYLGSRIAFECDSDFGGLCQEEGVIDPMDIYKAFISLKKSEDAHARSLFKHWRTFAKPVGLGYPGGLGAKTFVRYAKATYGLKIDLEMAKRLKEIWKATYPEEKPYFEWINTQCQDPFNPPKMVQIEGTSEFREKPWFAYFSPMGMFRARCDYCACANGAGLQTPSAEGALLGVFNMVRGCFDPTLESILYGHVFPLGFIHDENLGEVREDNYAHERVMEVARIMEEAMQVITPDVKIRTSPTLMRRWYKEAEPVFDADGRLTVWEPPTQKGS